MLFTEADGHHLKKAAFDLVLEIGMGFDPAYDGNMVGLPGMTVAKNRDALDLADLNGIHIGANFATHGGFGDAVMLKEESLAGSGSTAVAAHSRDDEGFQAEGGTFPDDGLKDTVDAGDAAAAGGDGDRLAGFDLILQGQAGYLLVDLGGDIRQCRPFQFLFNTYKERESHGDLLSKRDNEYIL